MISMQRVFSAEYADSLAKDLLAKQFVPSGVQTDYAQASNAPVRQEPFRSSSELVGGFKFPQNMAEEVDNGVWCAADFLGIEGYAPETETWNVIKYEEGEHFKLHTDCWESVYGMGADQRVMTALIVLQQANEGGETVFPNLGLTVRPPPGFMLTWRNVENHKCSHMTLHGGVSPFNGTKLVLTRWYRGM